MRLRSQKGFTGVDIAISVIIIFIFVSVIAVLIYQINSAASEIDLKTEAVDLAITEIENIKNEGFEAYSDRSEASGNSQICVQEEISGSEGFYRTITIIDYTDIEGNEDKIPDLVKQVTVEISYQYKGQTQTVELSTTLAKES